MNDNPLSFLIALLVLLAIVCALSARPLSLAVSSGIEERQQIKADYEQERNEQRLFVKEKMAPVVIIAGWVVIGASAIFFIVVVGGRVYADVSKNRRLSQLPVARQIAPGAFVTMVDGRNWLIDSYTGSRALLSESADVDHTRALIMSRLLMVDRLAESAEKIAAKTNNAAPADWLSHIGDSANRYLLDEQR